MIGRINGILLEKQAPHLLIDVNGIGYEVDAPMSTIYQLPNVGEKVHIFTHLVVREDAQLLYGFFTNLERQFFRTLIKVNGVGAKLAITILSGISADEFAQTVQQADAVALTKLPGIGKKTAERLIIEMRDRLKEWYQADSDSTATGVTISLLTTKDPKKEAESALVALGYKAQEATRMIARIETKDLDSEDIIKSALKASIK
ncbi:Holliday junction ATP-dependent DNA helicase RuvA [hydrothermal vent metagenome]|uniref:Holliday junction ATP-dependent DNA helicase RuvA n=1 Tax=hydrothermal vent metagenome TaxID=652676 RepID=A0A3B0ZE97_9ZZZZ